MDQKVSLAKIRPHCGHLGVDTSNWCSPDIAIWAARLFEPQRSDHCQICIPASRVVGWKAISARIIILRRVENATKPQRTSKAYDFWPAIYPEKKHLLSTFKFIGSGSQSNCTVSFGFFSDLSIAIFWILN